MTFFEAARDFVRFEGAVCKCIPTLIIGGEVGRLVLFRGLDLAVLHVAIGVDDDEAVGRNCRRDGGG